MRVREAHTALPGEGATPLRGQARAPLIVPGEEAAVYLKYDLINLAT